MQHSVRALVSAAVVGLLSIGTVAALATPAGADTPATHVVINEIESSGDAVGDWVELTNTGTATADLTGWTILDNDSSHTPYAIPAGTMLAPAGFAAFYVYNSFGLGGADSVNLSDGSTLVDSYSWTTAAAQTYGRCPDGTGPFVDTASPTRGAANDCGPASTTPAATWPGGATIATADDTNVFGTNLSGLAYEGTGTSKPGVLWAVDNGPSKLWKLIWDGAKWTPDTTDGWGAGKSLHYPDGTGDPDSEGVTLVAGSSAGGVFVSTERNNSDNKISRPEVLHFDVAGSATSLNATGEWNMTSDLPTAGANLGLEAIAWIPDSVLTAQHFVDEHTGTAYDPASYPNHGTGIFFTGLEANGMIYAYALDLTSNTYTRVATISSGFPSIMDLEFEPQSGLLWAECDNTCSGRTSTLKIAAAGATPGRFAITQTYERPADMPDVNNEGFAITPQSECVNGRKPVFWSDDDNDDGHALRSGTLDCTATQTVTFTSTPPAHPVVGQTYQVTATGGGSANPVVISVEPASAGTCSIDGSTVSFDQVGTCVLDADQAGNAQYDAGSATQTIVVAKAATTTTVTVTAHAITAQVTVTAPGAGTPTGPVTFSVGGTVIGADSLSSGTASISYTVPTSGAAKKITASYAGNSTLAGSTGSVTRSNPSITATITSAHPRTRFGWYRSAVKITFRCVTHGAKLATPCPTPVTLTGNVHNRKVSRTITAVDGGTATVTTRPISIDRTAPSVSIAGPRNRTYTGSAPKARCVARDGLSGIASCRLSYARQGNRTTVTAVATDRAGNQRIARITYRVVR